MKTIYPNFREHTLLPTVLILLLFAFYSCNKTNEKDAVPPNFIVFIADDVNFDDFGCYGNAEIHTPNIGQLAANGLKFTNFYLTASSCSPSRNSIMTGRYPHNTGAPELHQAPPDSMEAFPELLRRNGYYTGQSGKFHMGPYARRAFDVIIDTREDIGDGGEESWVKVINERPRNQPFMMWFAALDAHRDWGPNEFSGTHEPSMVTPPFYLDSAIETRKDLGKYYDEIKRFDHYIGEVVKELTSQGVLENTVIMIMADNGRPFPHSKTRVNDRGMKTPFIVHWPNGIQKQPDCSSLVSSIDIAPTILGLAGVEATDQFQGASFQQIITQPDLDFRNYVFAEHNWHDYEAHERMVRFKDFMYIRNSRPNLPLMGPADAIGSPSHQDLVRLKETDLLSGIQGDVFIAPRASEELYDCKNDPLQLTNLAIDPIYQVKLKEMQNALDIWINETGDNIPEQLTADWYTYDPGYIKTDQHGIRGETPGVSKHAASINKKGPF